MPLSTDEKLLQLSRDVIDAFDKVDQGPHPGFRPAHAKGVILTGEFKPSAEAASLTRAPHIQRSSTPVTVRLSNFAGVPNVADNDAQNASPGVAPSALISPSTVIPTSSPIRSTCFRRAPPKNFWSF